MWLFFCEAHAAVRYPSRVSRRLLLLLAAEVGASLLLCLAPANLPAATAIPDRYRRVLEQSAASGAFGTIAVGLIDGNDQKTWFFGKHPGAPPGDGSSEFELGAVTDVFSGILLAQALLDGKLRASDTLGSVLADVAFADPALAATPVLSLAMQQSGLPATPANLFPRDAGDPYAQYAGADLGAFLVNYRAAAWSRDYAYSPLNGAALGLVLGRVYDSDFRSLLLSKVLAPLGLKNTGFEDSAALRQGHAYGHPASHWHFDALAGAAGLRSSLSDLLTFMQRNLHPDSSPLRSALLLARQTRADSVVGGLGLGWVVHDIPGDGQTWPLVWRAGRTGGFSTFLGFRTDRQQAVVLLGDAADDLATLGVAWLSDQSPPPAAPAPYRPTPAQLEASAGLYRLLDGSDVSVRVSGESLLAQLRGQPAWPLQAVAADDFVAPGGGAGVSFVRNLGDVSGMVLRSNGIFVTGERLSARAPTLPRVPIEIDARTLSLYPGDYRVDADTLVRVTSVDAGLVMQLSGAQAVALHAYAVDRFADADGQNGLVFHRDDKGAISAVTLLLAGGEREATPANWRPL